jgi:hypothetical protein
MTYARLLAGALRQRGSGARYGVSPRTSPASFDGCISHAFRVTRRFTLNGAYVIKASPF